MSFAQVSVVNQEAEQFGVVEDSISSQVFNVAVQQYNAGNQQLRTRLRSQLLGRVLERSGARALAQLREPTR